MPEVTGDAAVLVDPYDVESIGDGMRRILDDPRLAEELRLKGLKRAREFSWERSVEKTQQRLSGGCGRRARRRDGAPGRVSGPRVALVHDWLTGMRGGEKVLEALCEIYPDADIFTLVHRRGSVSPAIERHPHPDVASSSTCPWPPRNIRGICRCSRSRSNSSSLDRYDLVISSSHCAAKSVVVPGRAVHLSYCHSPMRYAWDQFDAYFGPARVGRLREPMVLQADTVAAGAVGCCDVGARAPVPGQLIARCRPDPPIL